MPIYSLRRSTPRAVGSPSTAAAFAVPPALDPLRAFLAGVSMDRSGGVRKRRRLAGRTSRPKFVGARTRPHAAGRQGDFMAKTIYVGNLSYEATAEHLRELFAAHGEVTHAMVATHPETGRPRR